MPDGPPLPLLLVGPVTVDHIDDQRMPGGAVSYGAAVAAAFGIRARVLTIAGPDADLTPLEGHDVHLVKSDASVTFVFEPSDDGRRMRVPAQPSRPLSASDLPEDWHDPGTLLIAPLIERDVDTPSFEAIARSTERVGVMTQGLQRALDADGFVDISEPRNISLVRTSSHTYSFFRSEREAALWTNELSQTAVARGARLVTTREAPARSCDAASNVSRSTRFRLALTLMRQEPVTCSRQRLYSPLVKVNKQLYRSPPHSPRRPSSRLVPRRSPI